MLHQRQFDVLILYRPCLGEQARESRRRNLLKTANAIDTAVSPITPVHTHLYILPRTVLTSPSLPYKTHKIDISKDTQKEPWFRAINPNGRIPALTDTFTDGKTINLFESGSIMQYLVDRYDPEYKISFPKGSREYYEVNNWLFFMNAGVGPMQGQASK
jgi:hypothetical protein